MDDTSYFKSGSAASGGGAGAVPSGTEEIGASGGGCGGGVSPGGASVGSSAGAVGGGQSGERDGSTSGSIRRRSTSNSSVNRGTHSKVCILTVYCISLLNLHFTTAR